MWSVDWLINWRQWPCEHVCWCEAERLTFYRCACTRQKTTTTKAQKWVRSRPPIMGNNRNKPREEARMSQSIIHMEDKTSQTWIKTYTNTVWSEIAILKVSFSSMNGDCSTLQKVDPANQTHRHNQTRVSQCIHLIQQGNIFTQPLFLKKHTRILPGRQSNGRSICVN